MSTEYDLQLAAWKERNSIGHIEETNQDEMRMAAEDAQSKGKSWCFGCDKHMPIREMKLITRGIDAYYQMGEEEGDYISNNNRVRMCPACFDEHYGHNHA